MLIRLQLSYARSSKHTKGSSDLNRVSLGNFTGEMSSPADSDRSLESGEWNDEDQSFFFDTHPTPYASFDPDQSFEGYQYVFGRPQAGSNAPMGALGEPAKADESAPAEADRLSKSRERCCFNCGEPGHAVNQCPLPKDRERIRQSRLEFEETKAQNGDDGSGGVNGPARLHEQVASAKQRLQWLDEIKPGQPSRALIEALTWEGDARWHDTEDRKGASCVEKTYDLPHLRGMLMWGYPPGWVSSQDPIEHIRQRIKQDTEWDSVEVLSGFEADALEQKPNQALNGKADHHSSADHSGDELKRWVNYNTHLFDSFRLQAFDTVFRRPLPQMQQDDNRSHDRDWDRRYNQHNPASRSLKHDRHNAYERRWDRGPDDPGWPSKRHRPAQAAEMEEKDDRAALWNRVLAEGSSQPPPPTWDHSAPPPHPTPFEPPPPPPGSPPPPPPPPTLPPFGSSILARWSETM